MLPAGRAATDGDQDVPIIDQQTELALAAIEASHWKVRFTQRSSGD